MKLNGSQIIAECLLQEGIDVMFGLPGGAIMPLYDVWAQYPQIRHVLVRHEQGAAHMADGYARAKRDVGVCLGTSGPGATNLVTGILNAQMDSAPVVAITANVATHFIGSDAFQEADITGITIPVTVDLPGFQPSMEGNVAQIRKAARLIEQAKRPIILAGQGVLISGAAPELKELVDKTGVPVITTLLGISSFPESHPLALQLLGMHGWVHSNYAVHHCDLVIGIGNRFDDRACGKFSAFAPEAKIIHIDIDPAEIGKNVRVDVPIVGDVKRVLTKLIPEIDECADKSAWYAQIDDWRRTYPPKVYPDDTDELYQPQVMRGIYGATRGDAIVVADVGQHQMFAAQHYQFDEPNTWITSGGLGTMGFSLPAAIGAWFARPDKNVWCVIGDGCFDQQRLPGHGPAVAGKLLRPELLGGRSRGAAGLREAGRGVRHSGLAREAANRNGPGDRRRDGLSRSGADRLSSFAGGERPTHGRAGHGTFGGDPG